MTQQHTHEQLGIQMAGLRAEIRQLEEQRKLLEEQMNQRWALVNDLGRKMHSCFAHCFCGAKEFLTDTGVLPAGWSLQEMVDTGNNKLSLVMAPVCPKGHEAELQESKQWYLKELEAKRG